MSRDLLASSKALLELDAENALVPHGLGGHGRACLSWCVDEIERLRKRIDNAERHWIDATEIAIQKGDFRPLKLRVDASRTPFQATETT